MEEHTEAANKYKKESDNNKSLEEELENEMQNGKKDLARISKLLVAAEKELSSKNKLMDTEVNPQITEINAKLKSLRKRLADFEKSESNMLKDRSEQQENVTSLRSDMEELTAAEEEIKNELESSSSSSGIQLDAKKIAEYSKLREEVSARTASERAESSTMENEAKSKSLRITRLEQQEDNLRKEIEAGDRLILEYSERSKKLKGAIADGEKERAQATRDRDRMNEDTIRCTNKAQELNGEYDEVTAKLREVGDDKKRGKQSERINEAIETMQRIFSGGVHGRLVDLCKPIQKKYSQAIANTGGKHMDAIVVESKKVASECIQYLKDQRIGTCTFLPLDNIDVKPIPERLRMLAPKYRLCVDLVECDDIYKPAVVYALGTTLVCETLEEARELCFSKGEKNKVVTLNGHVISRNGAMTGGSMSRDTDRWEEKEVDKLKRRKTELEEQIAKNKSSTPTRQQMVDLETKLKTLQTRIQFSEADVRVTDEKLNQLKQQKD